jgi:transcriptional regulator with XRE-family HTH domain
MTRAGRDRSLTSIAAAAGVSVSTVSKVLNGRTDVASHTRERVAGILRTHGYRVQPLPGIGIVDLLIGGLDIAPCRKSSSAAPSAPRPRPGSASW